MVFELSTFFLPTEATVLIKMFSSMSEKHSGCVLGTTLELYTNQ